MHWFQGTIPEAIAEAKTKDAVFIVYISGDDERSQRMNATFETDEVTARLTSSGCVAVNLEGNSEVCQQFSQIYPVVLIPSTYFIGSNGMLLEIVGGDVEPQDFLDKIDNVLQSVKSSKFQDVGLNRANDTLPPDIQPINPTNNFSPSNDPAAEMSSSDSHANVTVDERIERAKQLLIQQKEQKARIELEEEKKKELERRKTGQEVQKLRQKQQDAETKQLADDLARERAEEKAARDRVKDQIAQDRAERAAKYQAEREEAELAQLEAKQAALQKEQEKASIEAAEKSNHARLQFRFPDGSSLTQQFYADDTLEVVRHHVAQSQQCDGRSFTLSTTFPRREFHETDYNLTLRELRLAPCSAILVLPQSAVAHTGNLGFLWTLIGPIIALFSYLRILIFGSVQPRTTPNSAPNARKRSNEGASSSNKESNADGPNSNVRKRKPGDTSASNFSRKDGNIHRLPKSKDDDEDNNTWNGNSTQQM